MQPQWPQMTSISAQLSLSCHYSPFPPFCFIQQRPLNLILVEKLRLTAVLWNEFIFFIHLYIHVHCSVAPAHLVGLVITNCIDEIVSIGIQCLKKENISVETLTLLESKFTEETEAKQEE